MAQAISDGVNHISSISRIHAPWKKITCNVSFLNVTLIIEDILGLYKLLFPKGAVKEFCSDSTLHGIRYFTEPKRHFIERLGISYGRVHHGIHYITPQRQRNSSTLW